MNEHTMLVKEYSETNPLYGKRPVDRTIEDLLKNGIVIIDKPNGPTSHQVASWVKDILQIPKAGHGGTLDPNVTGVLPVSLQSATRAIGLMHGAQKEYICTMRLHGNTSKRQIKDAARTFIGKIWQVPPREAAVKRVRRQRTIYYLNILEIDGQDVLFKVGCEGGTYIRVLCTDIGKKLGTGAHMHELRRTKSGHFNEDDTVLLQNLLDAFVFWKEEKDESLKKILRPLEDLLSMFPSVVVKDSAVDAICHGADATVPGVSKIDEGITKGNMVVLKTLKDEGIAVATALMDTKEVMEKDKGKMADTSRVLMERGIYPPMWKR